MAQRLCLWICLFALCACGPPAPPAPLPVDLVFLMRPGATTWFIDADGQSAGIDYDLAQLFARKHGLKVKITVAEQPAQQIADSTSRAAQIGAGGLYQTAGAIDAADGARLLISTGYYAVEPVLIYNVDGFKPESWADLAGETVGIATGAGLQLLLAGVRYEHPDVRWQSFAPSPVDSLIAQVADGALNYAVVASNELSVARSTYLNVEAAFAAGPKQELVWILPPNAAKLRDEVNAMLDGFKRDGTLQRLIDRYFGHVRRVERASAAAFQDRMRAVLPAYSDSFRAAQDATGIDWRLLAAVAYQESRWDPLAISETNVRGMMMLTEDTARRLSVTDRLDPRQSILAGARYIAEMKRALPARITEPDRTWLALAAFNIGIGHLEDARVLAARRKLNPDSWVDVKKTLPLLAGPEAGEETKYGFARGGQAVVFVETVRAYYDVLARLEKPYLNVRLRATN